MSCASSLPTRRWTARISPLRAVLRPTISHRDLTGARREGHRRGLHARSAWSSAATPAIPSTCSPSCGGHHPRRDRACGIPAVGANGLRAPSRSERHRHVPRGQPPRHSDSLAIAQLFIAYHLLNAAAGDGATRYVIAARPTGRESTLLAGDARLITVDAYMAGGGGGALAIALERCARGGDRRNEPIRSAGPGWSRVPDGNEVGRPSGLTRRPTTSWCATRPRANRARSRTAGSFATTRTRYWKGSPSRAHAVGAGRAFVATKRLSSARPPSFDGPSRR